MFIEIYPYGHIIITTLLQAHFHLFYGQIMLRKPCESITNNSFRMFMELPRIINESGMIALIYVTRFHAIIKQTYFFVALGCADQV